MIVINWNNPDIDKVGVDIGGGPIYYYQDAPFTGILQESFDDGVLHTEVQCVNGYPEGVEREYYSNGQLWQESYIKYNLPYGLMKEWDESGDLIHQYDWGPEPMG